ncbi:uncharacterized protein LOC135336065 [Halichondria panicea]|uniref:uncharacterized protein LOC135336065 n=1 Tax=Halichondria panicea TaxID=6063 RepID=UPI00312B6FDE
MSFIVDWITYMMEYLGLWSKPKTVILLGLDNSGKRVSFHILTCPDAMMSHDPAPMEEIKIDGVRIRLLCQGGCNRRPRLFLQDYCAVVDAAVFMVDAADKERLEEAKKELHNILADTNFPVLVLGNKIDLPRAVSEEELNTALGIPLDQKLDIETAKEVGRVKVFMCSAVKRIGYGEGFRWLMQQMHAVSQ